MEWPDVFAAAAPFLTMADMNKLTLLNKATRRAVRARHSQNPVVADVVHVAHQSVAVWAERLLNPAFIREEIEMIQQETNLYQQLDHLSYFAADAIRRRIHAVWCTNDLPALQGHASQKDLLSSLSAAGAEGSHVDEIRAWLKWYERFADHVAFGRVCLSVECAAHHFCAAARQRVLPIPLPHVEPVAPSLPRNLWSLILEFLPRFCLDTQSKLVALHPFFTFTLKHTGLWPVIQHYHVWRKLDALMAARFEKRIATNMMWQAPCSVVYDTFSHLLRDLHHAYSAYAAKFSDMRYKQMQYPPEEKHICIEEFVHTAQNFALESRGSGGANLGERVLRALRQLDFRLLDTYAFDVMSLHNNVINSLPLRAFHEGSKHRKAFRKDFVDPTPHSSHRGAQVEYALSCMREDLRHGRREMLTRLRELEAFFVAPLQRLVEELDDYELVPSSWSHPCASLVSGNANTVLPHATLNTLTQELVSSAEHVPTLRDYGALGEWVHGKWVHVEQVVHRMQRSLVEHVMPTLTPSLQAALEPCVAPLPPLEKLYDIVTEGNVGTLHWLTREQPVVHGIHVKPLESLGPFAWRGLVLGKFMPRQRRAPPLCLLMRIDEAQWVCFKLDVFKEELLADLLVAEADPEAALARHVELLEKHGRMTHVEKVQNAALSRYLERKTNE
jgi:hypothetical protein